MSSNQLELVGLEEARRRAEAEPVIAHRSRLLRQIDTEHDLLTALPTSDDLAFNHSGLCQTFLPHSRLASNTDVWKRQSGRFVLMVTPGVISPTDKPSCMSAKNEDYVGVPFGSKARLIMFHLQTEGVKSRTVVLGKNLSKFLRVLGLPRTGGPRGSIIHVREQCMRIARCTFSLQWTQTDNGGNDRLVIADTKIIDGLEMWNPSSDDWSATVELSTKFHAHLIEHAVPLDRRSIALLSHNSLGLDLYALFAYRLPKLRENLHLPWAMLHSQIGGSDSAMPKEIARRIREVLPLVKRAYPHANIEVTRLGLMLKPSKPSVPKDMVNGFRLIES